MFTEKTVHGNEMKKNNERKSLSAYATTWQLSTYFPIRKITSFFNKRNLTFENPNRTFAIIEGSNLDFLLFLEQILMNKKNNQLKENRALVKVNVYYNF